MLDKKCLSCCPSYPPPALTLHLTAKGVQSVAAPLPAAGTAWSDWPSSPWHHVAPCSAAASCCISQGPPADMHQVTATPPLPISTGPACHCVLWTQRQLHLTIPCRCPQLHPTIPWPLNNTHPHPHCLVELDVQPDVRRLHMLLGKLADLLHGPRRLLFESDVVQALVQVDGVLPGHCLLRGTVPGRAPLLCHLQRGQILKREAACQVCTAASWCRATIMRECWLSSSC